MKKVYVVAISVVMLVVFSGCSHENSNMKQASAEITFNTGSDDVIPVVKSVVTEAADDEDTTVFRSILADPAHTIPYVKLGETIQIEYKGKAPKSYQFMDYVLKEDGTLKYQKQKQAGQPIDLKFNEKTASFTLNENMFVYLSSNSKDYEPGAAIRGFRLLCGEGDNIQEYVFVVRTDAKQQV